MPEPVPKVFICYARADNDSENPRGRQLYRMGVHLKPYEGKAIEVFCDDLVSLGDQSHQRIQTESIEARVAILLVISNFKASDYIRNNKLPALLKKATLSGSQLKIIPVILSDSAFDGVEFHFPDLLGGPNHIQSGSGVSPLSPGTPAKSPRFIQPKPLAKAIIRPQAVFCAPFQSAPRVMNQGMSARSWTAPVLWRFGRDREINGGQTSMNRSSSPVEPLGHPQSATSD